MKKILNFIVIFVLFTSNIFAADEIEKGKTLLKSLSKKSLTKKETISFLKEYAIILEDERGDGEVTYVFDDENHTRYKGTKIISSDAWRFSKLGALRLFNGDIKLTWKIKPDKNKTEGVINIKAKFDPVGKLYQFSSQTKKSFFNLLEEEKRQKEEQILAQQKAEEEKKKKLAKEKLTAEKKLYEERQKLEEEKKKKKLLSVKNDKKKSNDRSKEAIDTERKIDKQWKTNQYTKTPISYYISKYSKKLEIWIFLIIVTVIIFSSIIRKKIIIPFKELLALNKDMHEKEKKENIKESNISKNMKEKIKQSKIEAKKSSQKTTLWVTISIVGGIILILIGASFTGGDNSGSNSQTYNFSSKRIVCTGGGCVIKCSYSGSRLDAWTKWYDDGYHVRLPRWGCPLRIDQDGYPAR